MDPRQVPNSDVLLYPCFSSYEISHATAALKSEQNRKFVAESFEAKGVLPLSVLCLQSMGRNYEKHQIPVPDVSVIQQRVFYDALSVDLPIRKCMKIDDIYYWKRVFNDICTDKMVLKQKNKCEDTPWKSLVLTIKYLELIETTPVELWQPDEMEEISKIVSPYVFDLDIKKLQQKRDESFQKSNSEANLSQPETPSQHSQNSQQSQQRNTITENENEDDEEEEAVEPNLDFPFEECHHVDLSTVRFLENLTSLSVEFAPPKLEYKYHSRYFNFSYVDVQCLASGIANLQNLKTFKIRRSRMDSVKLGAILDALMSTSIENVDFYFCELNDDCGEALYEFLVAMKTLKHLDLSGNYFKGEAVVQLSDGIAKTPSKLAYLGLSNNPMGDDCLCHLLNIVATYQHLEVLKLSGIQSTGVGSSCLAKMLRRNDRLEELHIIAIELRGPEFVAAMKINYKLQQCFCQACNLTFDEEFRVELYLKRNRYMKSHPYIGNSNITNEEIDEFLGGIRDPIFMKALDDRLNRHKCASNKPLNGETEFVEPDPLKPAPKFEILMPPDEIGKRVHI